MKRLIGFLSTTLSALLMVGLVACTFARDYSPELDAAAIVYGMSEQASGGGSGTFIAPDKVLTAAHVARIRDNSAHFWVEDGAGHKFEVSEVIYPDKPADVAILVIKNPEAAHATAPISCRVPAIGEELYNVGNPFLDIKWFWNKLWVSAYQSNYKAVRAGPNVNFNGVILFQGLAIGGMSGSAMFDKYGTIVGVLTIGLDVVEGIGSGIGGFLATEHVCDWLKAQIKTDDKGFLGMLQEGA